MLIENEDIGFVYVGQPVRIKLAAFHFQKYGMLAGVVKTVSADSSSRQNGQSPSFDFAFKVLVELSAQQLQAGEVALPLAAGMQVSAEIVQRHRTVLEYLLSPVQRVVSEAASER